MKPKTKQKKSRLLQQLVIPPYLGMTLHVGPFSEQTIVKTYPFKGRSPK